MTEEVLYFVHSAFRVETPAAAAASPPRSTAPTCSCQNIEKANEIVANGVVSIANAIYGNRTDLGNIMPNDGWKYRGRGIIQLTGRNNYKFYGEKLGIDLLNNPDLALSENIASDIACCYWIVRGLQSFARKADVKAVTKMINGGYNGLEDREKRFNKILKILKGL